VLCPMESCYLEDAQCKGLQETVVCQYRQHPGLVCLAKPEDKTLAQLTDILKKHYDPEPIVIAERFCFYQRTQKSGESVANFLASLRNYPVCASLEVSFQRR